MKRRAAVIVAVAITAWLLVLAGQRSMTTKATAVPAIVSAGELSRIHAGMSYEDCVRIIGAEGTPFGSSAAPEAPTGSSEWISYVWRNNADSYATVSFRDGAVERVRAFNIDQ